MNEKIEKAYKELLLKNQNSNWVNPELDIPNYSNLMHCFWLELTSYKEFRLIDGVEIISILNFDTTSFYIKID